MPSPAHTVWEYSGKPQVLIDYSKYINEGQCSHCGHIGQTVLVKRLVSKYFTNWDMYSNMDKPSWCNICIWTFKERNNRTEAILFTEDKLHTGYQIQSMRELLKKPLDGNSFLSVALKKNKHVLPYAQWGQVRIEDISVNWSEREVKWHLIIERLIAFGFTMSDIEQDDSPSFMPVIKLNRDDTKEVYSLWDELNPLRKFPQLFDFILELHKKCTMELSVITLKD